jgi:flagellar hook-length control protein FliK
VNSGGASAGGLRGAGQPLEREEPGSAHGSEEAAALWVALAQQVTQAQTPTLPGGEGDPTSAWHSSAGDLTPANGTSSAAGGAPADSEVSERMVLRVDGGELGELEVTLDREGGALRVVIGMENQHLVSSVLPDAGLLRSALESAGVNVQSLNVVPASEVGTVLAQRRLSSSGPKPVAEQGSQQDPEKAQKRTHKRLTLIG